MSHIHTDIDHPIGTFLYTISGMHCMTGVPGTRRGRVVCHVGRRENAPCGKRQGGRVASPGEQPVVRQALRYAIIVGAVLIAINRRCHQPGAPFNRPASF
jgi:hypothetical protein